MKPMRVALSAGAALICASTPAPAHVTVWPKQSEAGIHEKYDVRVPNEKQADTVIVEVRFPAGLRVSSFEQKPGWQTEPVRDGSGTVVGVRWSGRLPPHEFTEFGLLAVNPPSAADLSWTATQVYSDGTKIEWSGPPGSKTPAPHVLIR
jgi:hypothetical protein